MQANNNIKNNLYPVFLKLEHLHVLLVGGGNVALEKLQSLLSNCPTATVTIVAPFIRESTKQFIQSFSAITLIERTFEDTDINKKDIVICTTDNPTLHQHIKQIANAKGLLVNVADTPHLCDFYLGSIVNKGYVKMAISTNGKSPTVAKRLREVLTDVLPDNLDTAIDNIHAIRNTIKGDFQEKVTKLNAITKVMVDTESTANKRWKKITSYSVIAFALMLIGHFIFSYVPLQSIGNNTISWAKTLDETFPIMLLAGFLGQLVDGALGMGYGVTSASILLSAGVNPAAISGAIHTAEMFASGASGYSHFKIGNVNKKLFKALLIPGVLGAILGAIALFYTGEKYGQFIRPFIAVYTLFLGIKFILNAFKELKPQKKFKHYRVLAAFGGFFDSFGGGGWGPIVTSTLINNGRNHKYVVGSVSLTEFFVTLFSAFTFFILMGVSHWQTITGLIVGSLIAAPIAAKLAGKLPRKTAFILLGVLVIIWSIRILIKLL
jgi:uncharacterized protein